MTSLSEEPLLRAKPVNSSVARHPPINENRGDVFSAGQRDARIERMLGYVFSNRHVSTCYKRELAAI